MNVNKIFVVLLLLTFNSFGQEKEVFFILNKDNPEYVFFINGKKEYNQKTSEAEKFFITSTEEYATFLKEKKELLNGERKNLPGLTFKVKKQKTIYPCDFQNLLVVDYKWLTENTQIKNEETIELNRFENLSIVLKEGDHWIIFNVIREFSAH